MRGDRAAKRQKTAWLQVDIDSDDEGPISRFIKGTPTVAKSKPTPRPSHHDDDVEMGVVHLAPAVGSTQDEAADPRQHEQNQALVAISLEEQRRINAEAAASLQKPLQPAPVVTSSEAAAPTAAAAPLGQISPELLPRELPPPRVAPQQHASTNGCRSRRKRPLLPAPKQQFPRQQQLPRQQQFPRQQQQQHQLPRQQQQQEQNSVGSALRSNVCSTSSTTNRYLPLEMPTQNMKPRAPPELRLGLNRRREISTTSSKAKPRRTRSTTAFGPQVPRRFGNR